MKAAIQIFGLSIAPIMVAGVLWFGFGFSAWEWDVKKWHGIARFIYISAVIVSAVVSWGTVIFSFYAVAFPDKKQRWDNDE